MVKRRPLDNFTVFTFLFLCFLFMGLCSGWLICGKWSPISYILIEFSFVSVGRLKATTVLCIFTFHVFVFFVHFRLVGKNGPISYISPFLSVIRHIYIDLLVESLGILFCFTYFLFFSCFVYFGIISLELSEGKTSPIKRISGSDLAHFRLSMRHISASFPRPGDARRGEERKKQRGEGTEWSKLITLSVFITDCWFILRLRMRWSYFKTEVITGSFYSWLWFTSI